MAEKAERAARAAAYQEADWIRASEEVIEVRLHKPIEHVFFLYWRDSSTVA